MRWSSFAYIWFSKSRRLWTGIIGSIGRRRRSSSTIVNKKQMDFFFMHVYKSQRTVTASHFMLSPIIVINNWSVSKYCILIWFVDDLKLQDMNIWGRGVWSISKFLKCYSLLRSNSTHKHMDRSQSVCVSTWQSLHRWTFFATNLPT